MSNYSRNSGRIKKRTKGFILVPLVFILITVIAFYAILSPILAPFSSAFSMLFLDSRTQQDQILYSQPVNMTDSTISVSNIELPNYGDLFGNIQIDNTAVNADLYFGDGVTQLNKGVGIYEGSSKPGFGNTVLIAGHNNTFFSTLGDAKVGSNVYINTNYGSYVYKITDMKVADENDITAYNLYSDHENLIMYTCYPFATLGITPQRYFVYADYVSGPQINIYD